MQLTGEVGEVFFTHALLVSAFEVQCEMPFSVLDTNIEWARVQWLVSVSSDNETFSDTTRVFVFDSKCLVCDNETFACEQKVSCIFVLSYVCNLLLTCST